MYSFLLCLLSGFSHIASDILLTHGRQWERNFEKLTHLGLRIKATCLISCSERAQGRMGAGWRTYPSVQDFPPFPVHILPGRAQYRCMAVPPEGKACRLMRVDVCEAFQPGVPLVQHELLEPWGPPGSKASRM